MLTDRKALLVAKYYKPMIDLINLDTGIVEKVGHLFKEVSSIIEFFAFTESKMFCVMELNKEEYAVLTYYHAEK